MPQSKPQSPERRCRICQCRDADCTQCIARTGAPCTWVAGTADLCSACTGKSQVWPLLYKRATSGKTVVWRIAVHENPQNGYGEIIVTWGLTDGEQQTTAEAVKAGKNLGRKNATTPYTQALAEAEARWTKQKDRKGYGTDAAAQESATKRAAAPMLAHVYADYQEQVDWATAWIQPKLDGFRCLASMDGDEVVLRSREGKPIVTMGHTHDAVRAVLRRLKGTTLDGELYRHRTPFEQIASAIRAVKTPSPLAPTIVYHVYDLAIPDIAQNERIKLLQRAWFELPKLQQGNVPLCVVPTAKVQSHDELITLRARWVEEGYEGLMLRWGNQLYAAGKRSKHLLKVKAWLDAEFTVSAVKEGRGTHAGMAIFRCTADDKQIADFDVLAPGTHEEKRQYLQEAKKWRGKKLTVEYFELSQDKVPRFPRAKRFREDD